MTPLSETNSSFLMGFLHELAAGDWQAVARRFPTWEVEQIARLPEVCEGTCFVSPGDDFLSQEDRLQSWTFADGLGGLYCRLSLLTDGSDQYAADIVFSKTAAGEFDIQLIGIIDRRVS